MGRRGPKGKPAEVEAAQGFPRRRKAETKAKLAAASELQQSDIDSSFVPPSPPYPMRKAERAVWEQLIGNPATRLWFKRSDHNLIARYCYWEALHRAMVRRNPRPTITVTNTQGDRVPKSNPAHDKLERCSRELRAIEAQLGGTPMARMNLVGKMGSVGDGAKTPPAQTPDHPPPPEQTPRPSPIGVLRSPSEPPPGSKPN